ncbi:MAG TPA: YajQ family cyclic di-GMP-binding protein [Bdellovibrionota bacterium]|nr:YajQ family cyclic di-GMP-binding protein [Bdellovibrionota bacterium]
MPSFDIVSQLNLAEVDNAVQQTAKEILQRYDFKGTDSIVQRTEKEITLESADEFKVKAALDVLQGKIVKRGVSLKCLKAGNIEPAAKGRARVRIELMEGIDGDRAREIVKKIKDTKMKVQAAIQEQQVRVSGKKRDDLQEVIALMRTIDFPLPLQFINFRE